MRYDRPRFPSCSNLPIEIFEPSSKTTYLMKLLRMIGEENASSIRRQNACAMKSKSVQRIKSERALIGDFLEKPTIRHPTCSPHPRIVTPLKHKDQVLQYHFHGLQAH
jgi:hypothetical protein